MTTKEFLSAVTLVVSAWLALGFAIGVGLEFAEWVIFTKII